VNKRAKIIFLLLIFLLNLIDLYFKYTLKNKYYHDISWKLLFLPFFFIIFSFILIFNKNTNNLNKLIFYLLLILISSFSNLADIIINKGKIINYLNFYFFYNNLSDILVFFVTIYIIFDFINDHNS
jgi:hypothetical protein